MEKEINIRGYVTEQELSDDLKEKLKKIDTIKMSAKDIPLADDENNFKNDNVEEALSECIKIAKEAKINSEKAFQEADNGKKLIADAIGSPLSATDDFNTINDKINSIKSNMINSLNRKSVPSYNSDSLYDLANKINNIKGYTRGDRIPINELNIDYDTSSLSFTAESLNTSFDCSFDGLHGSYLYTFLFFQDNFIFIQYKNEINDNHITVSYKYIIKKYDIYKKSYVGEVEVGETDAHNKAKFDIFHAINSKYFYVLRRTIIKKYSVDDLSLIKTFNFDPLSSKTTYFLGKNEILYGCDTYQDCFFKFDLNKNNYIQKFNYRNKYMYNKNDHNDLLPKIFKYDYYNNKICITTSPCSEGAMLLIINGDTFKEEFRTDYSTDIYYSFKKSTDGYISFYVSGNDRDALYNTNSRTMKSIESSNFYRLYNCFFTHGIVYNSNFKKIFDINQILKNIKDAKYEFISNGSNIYAVDIYTNNLYLLKPFGPIKSITLK